MSPSNATKTKSLRFGSADLDDLERQITTDIGKFKINFQDEKQRSESKYSGQLTSTGGEIALMANSELQGVVIKLKTDNEILNITLKHLQEEMNMKSEVIRRQHQEMAELRQTVLDL
jgi:hypothetical protein